MEILQPDRYQRFESPISDKFVRIGTIGDGSCFIHAIMYAINDAYSKMSYEKRSQYIRDERYKMAEVCDWSRFVSLGKAELMKLWFTIGIRDFIQQNMHEFGKVCSWVEWDDKVIPHIVGKWKTSNINDFVDEMAKSTGLPNKTAEHVARIVCDLCIQQFKHHIKTGWVDIHLIEYIQHIYKINIIIIDSRTKQIYTTFENPTYKTTVRVLWINESHYEIIGTLEPNATIVLRF